MAEELQDASYTLPRVMLWATIINGGMMFIMAVTVVYCIGDLDAGKQLRPVTVTSALPLLTVHQCYKRLPVIHTSRYFTT
jgi:amino acid transporter